MHMLLFHWVMLHTCILSTLSQNTVRGMVGQAINLPCTYHVRWASDLTVMCWGRGSCPTSKCSDEILRTDGRRVTSKISSRYHLKGYVTRGDVSLTIENLNERDKGLYCCRIEIRGWFNDIKKTLNLQVERAPTTIFTTTITTTSQMTTTTTLTTTSLTTTPTVYSTFHLTTEPTSTATAPVTDDSTLSTSSVSRNIAVTTTAPSFLLTTELASTTTAPATDGTTLPVFSVSRSISVTTTAPSFLLTTKPASTAVLSTTDGLTLSTSSVSTASAFLVTPTPLLDTKSSPTSFQNDFVTTKTDFPSTVLSSADSFCSGDLQSPLILVVRRMKCKKKGKYESDGMESLNEQEEEPEQTFSGPEGENGLFPL